MKKPKFFNCYFDNAVMLSHLSDEQAGKLWKGVFAFANSGEKCTFDDPIVALAFDVMTQQIQRDFSKYKEKCEQNKINRAKADDRQRLLTTVDVGDQEEEKEEEKDKEKDKEDNKEKEDEENKEDEKDSNKKQAVGHSPTVGVSFVKDVVDYLNMRTCARYKADSKSTARLINARAREGFTLDDFKKVIDNRIAAWGKDKNMQQYLRPETLFSRKFESYLNSPVISQKSYTQIFDYDEEF